MEDLQQAPEKSISPVPRVKVVTFKRNNYGGVMQVSDSQSSAVSHPPKTECAAVLRKWALSGKVPYGEIEIFDADLRERLKSLLAHYPTHSFVGESTSIESPYESIVLNWDLLRR